jgi:Ca2+-binding EF-hand superfamily protein
MQGDGYDNPQMREGPIIISKGGDMKVINILCLVFAITVGIVSLVRSTGLPDEMARNAYKQVLFEADKNKDGKLSVAECKAMFKDKIKGEKNCDFWDADHDGLITEEEYVSQVMSLRKKK